jgi:hypothetical protein
MAVRCSACGGWIKTTGGPHECPGKPKAKVLPNNDNMTCPVLRTITSAEDIGIQVSPITPRCTHIKLICKARPLQEL